MIVPTNDQAGINFDSLYLPRNRGSENSWTKLNYQSGASRPSVTPPNASYAVYSVGIEQVNGYGSASTSTDPVE